MAALVRNQQFLQNFTQIQNVNNTQARQSYKVNKHYVVKSVKEIQVEGINKRQLRCISEAYAEVRSFYKVVYVSRVLLGLTIDNYINAVEYYSDFPVNRNSHSHYERFEYLVASLHKLRIHYVTCRLLACSSPSGDWVTDSYLDDKEFPVEDNLLYGADFDFYSWLKGEVTFGLNPNFPQYHGRNFSDIYAEMRPDIMAVQNGELERGSYDGRSVPSGMKEPKEKDL